MEYCKYASRYLYDRVCLSQLLPMNWYMCRAQNYVQIFVPFFSLHIYLLYVDMVCEMGMFSLLLESKAVGLFLLMGLSLFGLSK